MSRGKPVAELLPTHTPELFELAVRRAVAALREGDVVALPTETVYGLAANALNAEAVGRIFEAKGRPTHNPLIVHVCDAEMAARCVAEWPGIAGKLAKAFWPGPLTLVLPKSDEVPEIVTAGGRTVGVRWPAHPFIQAVIRECGFPLAAPSANLSNRLSPTRAEHVQSQLGTRIRLIVDGGPCPVGIESTVLDLSSSPPKVLRPGIIHEESLRAFDEVILFGGDSAVPNSDFALRSPGLLPKHYSPQAQLVVRSWNDDADLARIVAELNANRQKVHVIVYSRIPTSGEFGRIAVIPHDAKAYARALYAELHACDQNGAELIIVETPPEGAEWFAIDDRLRRAATG